MAVGTTISKVVRSDFEITVIHRVNGVDQDLNGYTINLTIKKKLTDNDDAAVNKFTYSVSSSVTSYTMTNADNSTGLTGTNKTPGEYYYQVQMIKPNTKRDTKKVGKWIWLENIVND